MKYIDINKGAIPYYFEMQLAGQTWGFEVRYNQEYDFFTIDLFKGRELIVAGEKVVYGRPLFNVVAGPGKPAVDIVPYDLSENANRAGWDELGKSVFLYLFEVDNNE